MIFLIISLPICFSNTLSLVYDDNGNLLSDGEINRTYNSLNQLWKIVNATDGTILQEYTYHPTEERVFVKKDYVKDETTYYFSKEFVRVINSSGSYDHTYVFT